MNGAAGSGQTGKGQPPTPRPRTRLLNQQDLASVPSTLTWTEGSAAGLVTPPPLPPKPPHLHGGHQWAETLSAPGGAGGWSSQGEESIEHTEGLQEWWSTVPKWDEIPTEYQCLTEEEEARSVSLTAEKVRKGLLLFHELFVDRAESLRQRTVELRSLARDLDKLHKKTRIAGITGGTAGAVGGTAAVAGIILAPFTFGTSLLVTAAGVGVAVAGGATGAGAAITDKVQSSTEKKKVEQLAREYQQDVGGLCDCLRFVHQGMQRLRRRGGAGKGGGSCKVSQMAEEEVAGLELLADAALVAGQITEGMAGDLVEFFLGVPPPSPAAPNGRSSKKGMKGKQTKLADTVRQLCDRLDGRLSELCATRDQLAL
ncbi:apolipoprotein L domain-containing protein 1 isoform X2 [Amia ocellicauda]|uniref:apolipoprotein L domain-containing protein 1 isoform X2 n=1 Tax=Amia ocellicauda TaxID=2972642 RepID=UPI003464D911